MKKLKYTHNILGVLPLSRQEIEEIAAHLFGPSSGTWKVEEEDCILTIASFAKPKDRQRFVDLLEALLGPLEEAGREQRDLDPDHPDGTDGLLPGDPRQAPPLGR
jgi:hypothetical protein